MYFLDILILFLFIFYLMGVSFSCNSCRYVLDVAAKMFAAKLAKSNGVVYVHAGRRCELSSIIFSRMTAEMMAMLLAANSAGRNGLYRSGFWVFLSFSFDLNSK